MPSRKSDERGESSVGHLLNRMRSRIGKSRVAGSNKPSDRPLSDAEAAYLQLSVDAAASGQVFEYFPHLHMSLDRARKLDGLMPRKLPRDTGDTCHSYDVATGGTGATASSSNSEEAPVQAVAHSSGSSSKRPMEDTQGETPEQNEEAPARKYQRQEEEIEEPEEMVGSLMRMSAHIEKEVDVAEMYSPERVTAQAKKWGMRAGEAMDITTG